MEQATEKQIKFMKQLGLDVFPGLSKQAAKEMIAAKLESEEKPEVVKIGSPQETKASGNGKFTTMYVSYAKDIFCNIFSDHHSAGAGTLVNNMSTAIALVKQARSAFE